MEDLELSAVLAAMHDEIAKAADTALQSPIRFPITQVQVELQVAVTRTAEGKAGIKFMVLELGGEVTRDVESIQRITLTLGTPVNANDEPILVAKHVIEKPR